MRVPVYRSARIGIAALSFVLFLSATWFVKGYEGWYAGQIGSDLLKIAAGRYTLGVLIAAAVILVLTLLFGRIYCSVVCPLGILQDLMMMFKRKFRSQRSYRVLRYSVFGFVIASLAGGFILPLALLMPSSNFLMVENNIFRKVWQMVVEQLEWNMPNQALNPAVSGYLAAWGVFILLLVLARWRGRVYCNTLCPVGALLGLFARGARFKIFMTDACVSCGACERACKSGCIDAKAGTVNTENCVMCLNCLDKCKFHALKFGRGKKKVVELSVSRRNFLVTGGAVAGGVATGLVVSKFGGRTANDKVAPVMPPGAGSREEFLRKCVSCGLCIGACKGHVLTHSSLEYGIGGILQPYLNFKRGACEFNCTSCMDVCPCGALEKISLEEKKRLRLGVVHYNRSVCIPYVDGTDCGACSEHCPVGALEMVPYKATKIPHVHTDLCIGCGACQNICPVTPTPAVVVHGVSKQFLVEKPKQTPPVKLKAEEDFPF